MSAKKIKVGDCFKSEGNDKTVFVSTSEVYEHYTFGTIIDGKFSSLESSIVEPSFPIDCVNIIPTLHLSIANDAKKYGGEWFSMILRGVKTEEYRTFFGIAKGSPVNIKTLVDWGKEDWQWLIRSFTEHSTFMYDQITFKPWKVLHLTNGYGHHRPQLWVHIEGITIGRGKPEWGAPDHDVFIIRLGKVFHTKNV
jgi:hypothetical protein